MSEWSLTGLMRFRCICLSSHRLIMDRSRKWPDLRSKMTWQTSHQVQPSLLHLHRHYSNDQCQLRRQWNADPPEMNLIAVSARLQVIPSFWKNKINFDKMAPEMQRQCPQHRIRISIISPIFQLALISRSEKRPFSRCLPYWSPLAVATVTSRLQSCTNFDYPCLVGASPCAFSRPALKLRRRPINAPKRSGSGALRRRAV